MALVEFGRAVQTHAAPHRRARPPQSGGAPEVAVGGLQCLDPFGVHPDHEVGVGPHPGHVVDPADHHAVVLLLLEEHRGLVADGRTGLLVVTQLARSHRERGKTSRSGWWR